MNGEMMTTTEDSDGLLGSMVQQHGATVSTAIQLAAAMVDKRIATARAYPRKISRFKGEASQLLREDLETARSAEYAKPVGGGVVRGPSIRLAELAAMCWGNLEVEVAEPIVTDKSVIVKAIAWDLERNYRQEAIATTSIVNKQGNRFQLHMIETAALATASKAKRNAICAVIPRAYINDLLEVAREVARGNKKPLEVVRKDTLDYFARTHKVSAEQIYEFLGVGGFDDITEQHLDDLRPVATAIKEGTAQVDEFFQTKTDSKLDAVKAKLAERRAAQSPPPPPALPKSPDAAAAPPAPAKDTTLTTLLFELEVLGGLPTFLGQHNVTVEDLERTKTATRSKWCDTVNREIKRLKEERGDQ